jgi:hypothetical protein
MYNLPEDQKVVDLLTKLKRSSGGYPPEMLQARRRAYIKQVANAGLGIGIGAAIKNAVRGGSAGDRAASTTVTSKILETALMVAIALEAGTVAYIYRERITHAVKSYVNTPAVQEVTTASEQKLSNPALLEVLGTPSAFATPTPTGTPSGTPSSELAGDNNQNNNGVNANATPNPNGNNGNHYGQTPQPVRTRENNGGAGGNNNEGGGGTNNGGNGGGNNNGGGNQP